jgi:hypothetical protein
MTTEHMKTSMGRMSVRGTLPCEMRENEETLVTVKQEMTDKKAKAHLSSRRVQSKRIPQLLLRHGSGRINLVTKNEEGDLVEFLNREEGVEFGLGLVEALRVLRVDEEDNAVDFGEVVLPEAASWEWGGRKGEGSREETEVAKVT